MARCDDDSFDALAYTRAILTAALRLGARAAGTADHAGNYALLACAARFVRKVRGLDAGIDVRLRRALDRAADDPEDPEEPGDTLRDAIEDVLGHGEPFDDDPADPLAASHALIDRAISIGAPSYNAGDHQGCYDVYACTARAILATIKSLPDPAAARLRAGLDECLAMDDPNAQAWAMRHAFDAVLDMTADGGVPRQVLALISTAISIGAPAFNAGDHRGCYETYAATARSLVAGDTPDAVKGVLRRALTDAGRIRNPTRQAWILREAFDELLGEAP